MKISLAVDNCFLCISKICDWLKKAHATLAYSSTDQKKIKTYSRTQITHVE